MACQFFHAGSVLAVGFLLKGFGYEWREWRLEIGDWRWMSKANGVLCVGVGGFFSDGVGGFGSFHSLDLGIHFTLE